MIQSSHSLRRPFGILVACFRVRGSRVLWLLVRCQGKTLTDWECVAYDLLTGPLASEYGNLTAQADPILQQAKSLGDNLKFAFDTPTGIPDNSIFLDPARLANSTTNGVATIGTLILEWTRLSDLTGDATYGELAKKGESYLINPLNPSLGEPFPGLLGTDVSIANGSFLDSQGGWTGGTDSYYEYLIKAYLYDPVKFATYKDRWVEAVDSSIKHLASHPTSRPDLTFLAYYFNNSDSGIFYYSEHRKLRPRTNSSALLTALPMKIFCADSQSVMCDKTNVKGATRPRAVAWDTKSSIFPLYTMYTVIYVTVKPRLLIDTWASSTSTFGALHPDHIAQI